MDWKKGVAIAAFGGACYMFGHMDGGAPPGEKPSVAAVSDAADTGGQMLHAGTQTAQTIIGEAGSLTATAGNAASGAGTGVQNTVPGAPPK